MQVLISLWTMRHYPHFCLAGLERCCSFKALEVLFCLGYTGFIHLLSSDKWIILFACFGSQICFVISTREARLWLEIVDTMFVYLQKKRLSSNLWLSIWGHSWTKPLKGIVTCPLMLLPLFSFCLGLTMAGLQLIWELCRGDGEQATVVSRNALIIVTALVCGCWRLGLPSCEQRRAISSGEKQMPCLWSQLMGSFPAESKPVKCRRTHSREGSEIHISTQEWQSCMTDCSLLGKNV